MRRIASLDTATRWGSVALLEGMAEQEPVVVAEAGILARDSLASHVLALLDRLLAEAAWSRSSVDAWVVTRGPGSFTGLRVGLGTARGLALASGRPALGVGTLEAMAEALGAAESDRVPLLDAGRGEVYGARYDPASSPPRELEAPWLGRPERATAVARPAVVFGPGAEEHAERLLASGAAIRLCRSPRAVAAGAGAIAWHRLRAGDPLEEEMTPLYLRPSDAELAR